MPLFDTISNAVKPYDARSRYLRTHFTIRKDRRNSRNTSSNSPRSTAILKMTKRKRLSTIFWLLCATRFCRLNFSATVSDALAVSLTAKRIPTPIRQIGCLITALTLHNMLPLHTKSTAGQDALIQANKIYPNKQAL